MDKKDTNIIPIIKKRIDWDIFLFITISFLLLLINLFFTWFIPWLLLINWIIEVKYSSIIYTLWLLMHLFITPLILYFLVKKTNLFYDEFKNQTNLLTSYWINFRIIFLPAIIINIIFSLFQKETYDWIIKGISILFEYILIFIYFLLSFFKSLFLLLFSIKWLLIIIILLLVYLIFKIKNK